MSIAARGFVPIALLLLSNESHAFADGFRCPRTDRLVEEGDTMSQVWVSCGTPRVRQNILGRRGAKSGELWIYDFGPSYFVRILRFNGNYLTNIADGMYGSSPELRFDRLSWWLPNASARDTRPHQGIGQRVSSGIHHHDVNKPIVIVPVLGGLHADYRRAA
jgi:hypothetical protein